MPLPVTKTGIFSATDFGPGWFNIILGMYYGATGSGRVRVPFPEDAPDFIRQPADLMSQGKFRGAFFVRRYSLNEITDAFLYFEKGKTGIVVVDVC